MLVAARRQHLDRDERMFVVIYRRFDSPRARKSLKSAEITKHSASTATTKSPPMPQKPIPLGRMDHLALPTTDAARGERFYRDVLGFRAVPRPSFSFDGRWLVHDQVEVVIHLIHNSDFKPLPGPLNTMNGHFALQCTDIDSALEMLEQQGIEFVERRLPDHGYRQVFFRDPDGNIIELGEWPDK